MYDFIQSQQLVHNRLYSKYLLLSELPLVFSSTLLVSVFAFLSIVSGVADTDTGVVVGFAVFDNVDTPFESLMLLLVPLLLLMRMMSLLLLLLILLLLLLLGTSCGDFDWAGAVAFGVFCCAGIDGTATVGNGVVAATVERSFILCVCCGTAAYGFGCAASKDNYYTQL